MAVGPPDVVIIGGGIIGCATALELAQRGLRPLIVERDSVGSHASGFPFGELLPWWGRGIPGPVFEFGRRCLNVHTELQPALHDLTEIDTGFRLADAISVALTNDDHSLHGGRNDWLAGQGAEVEWLDGPALRSIEPRLAPDIEAGLQVSSVGVLDAYRYLPATAQAAERHGAVVRHGSVTGIQFVGTDAVSVSVGADSIPCGAVVIAAGPWSADASAWLGVDVPVQPLKGQIVRLETTGPEFRTYVGWRDYYSITKSDGLLWAGSTEEHFGFNDTPTTAGRDDILINLSRVVPSLADAGIEGHTACLRPLAADGIPIVGRAANRNNVYLATGTGRSGLLLAQGIAQAITDLIATGSTDWDIQPYSPSRFGAIA